MRNKNNSQSGFSIVIAMGFTIILSLVSILILDFVIPFNQNVKGVENGSSAFYNAYTGIEGSMFQLSKNSVGYSGLSPFPSSSTGSQYELVGMTSYIPNPGEGNSEYDNNWNRFDPNIPIQLQLGTDGIDFDNTIFRFRIPDLNRDTDITNDGGFLAGNQEPIINWVLSGLDTLSNPVVLNTLDDASNSHYIRKQEVNGEFVSGVDINLGGRDGIPINTAISCSFQNFYENSGCSQGIDSNHTIKLSIIDQLTLNGGKTIPYLEYQIEFKDSGGSDISIPGRYSIIRADGKSFGFKKSLDIKVPQTSTNQAFDFAVFQ